MYISLGVQNRVTEHTIGRRRVYILEVLIDCTINKLINQLANVARMRGSSKGRRELGLCPLSIIDQIDH
jgi:hypothetical protein